MPVTKIDYQNNLKCQLGIIFKDKDITFDLCEAKSKRDYIKGFCNRHKTGFSFMVQTALIGRTKCTQCIKERGLRLQNKGFEYWSQAVQDKNRNTVDLSRFEFKNAITPSIIICTTCGKSYTKSLKQATDNYLCQNCSQKWHKVVKQYSFDKFVAEANKKFNNSFTYIESSWKGYDEPMDIKYKDSIYSIKPKAHIHSTYGCVKDYWQLQIRDEKKNKIESDLSGLIAKGYKFIISDQAADVRRYGLITGTCDKGHTETKKMFSWLKNGCSYCSRKSFFRTAKETEKRLMDKYPNYSFDVTAYQVSKDRIKGTCDKGHTSIKNMYDWLKYPCHKCTDWGQSKIERNLIEIIKDIKPDINLIERAKIEGMEVDILLPDYNLAIEVHGIYWHSTKSPAIKNHTIRHYQKYVVCKKNNIRLIQVFSNEWKLKTDKIINLIKNIIHCPKPIYARKTTVKPIDNSLANRFYEQYHLQGATRNQVSYGLFYEDNLIASMSFSRGNAVRAGKDWELCRFAFKDKIIGGAGKFLNKFIIDFNPERIISFSDNRFFTGDVYNKLGFEIMEEVRPDYQYTRCKDSELFFSKSSFQRKKIPSWIAKLGVEDITFDPDTDSRSEKEITETLGFYRAYDAGKIKWLWSKATS